MDVHLRGQIVSFALRRLPAATVAFLTLGAAATPAFADATLFFGSTSTPSSRSARGVAVGMSVLVVGFEVEYSATSEEFERAAPSLRTGMANVFVQTPVAIAGFQPYFTAGGGGYRERLGADDETNVAVNTGGGVKISLAGPLHARIDYRVMRLHGQPLHPRAHRLYAGLNVRF